MSFKLQKLPHLALIEVVKSMEPQEMLFLATLSHRIRLRIKQCTKKLKTQLMIEKNEFRRVGCYAFDQFLIWLPLLHNYTTTCRSDSLFPPQAQISIGGHHTSPNFTDAFKKIIDFFAEFTNLEAICFEINDGSSAKSLKLIEHAVNRGVELEQVLWNGECSEREAKRLVALGSTANQFQFWQTKPEIEESINNFTWIKLDLTDLLLLRNCPDVDIQSNMSSSELNEFLKECDVVGEWTIHVLDEIVVKDLLRGLRARKVSDEVYWWMRSYMNIARLHVTSFMIDLHIF